MSRLKKEIRALGKKYRPSVDEKLELVNKQIEKLELERKMAQISAERAVALRTLYFNAGLSPFGKTLLKAPIKDITVDLRINFSRNLTEMLGAASHQVKNVPQVSENAWAKKAGWLEELMNQPAEKTSAKAAAIAATPHYGAEAASYTVMQLGAYEQRENATADWNKLKQAVPALQAYQPKLERSGKYYRLTVTSAQGGLQEICRQLQNQNFECLLRMQ